jgi:hypothetical protein
MGATMAKAKPKAKPKQVPQVHKSKVVTVNIKASEEWKDWLDRLAIHCRTDVAKLIDRGLILVAKAEGFNEEVPRR